MAAQAWRGLRSYHLEVAVQVILIASTINSFLPLMSKRSELKELVTITIRPDAWEIVCEAFEIDSSMKDKIWYNSDDSFIRLVTF